MRTNEPEPETIQVEFSLSVELAGFHRRETMEFEADASYEEIEKDWEQWVRRYVDGGFKRK